MIAIHYQAGHFCERWVAYCESNQIPYKIVDVYSNDIIEQLRNCEVFMWHFDHMSHSDSLFAKQLIQALDRIPIKVFPDVNTSWHFDDKIGQKYLLESIDAPFVKTYIFYNQELAKLWAKETEYPKVFKLRGGAGSLNVKLVRNKNQALFLIRKAFNSGFSQFSPFVVFKERVRKFYLGKSSLLSVLKWFLAIFLGSIVTKLYRKEIGYVYFQDFIPGNLFDIRVVVIGSRAFAIKRLVRKNDFRASGSGSIVYRREEIPLDCIRIAFSVNKKINAQAMTFDFVFNKKSEPLIVEVSFGYTMYAYDECDGYWDDSLNWYEGKYNHEVWILQLFLDSNKN